MFVEDLLFWGGIALAVLAYLPALAYAITYYVVLAVKRSDLAFVREVIADPTLTIVRGDEGDK